MKSPLILFLFSCTLSIAQTPDEKEAVMKPALTFFEAMKKGDSALLHSTYIGSAPFHVIGKRKDGTPTHSEFPLSQFLKITTSPRANPMNEVIWDEKIFIDGNFGLVRADYAFYSGSKFSHCGTDVFSLFKDAQGSWKIFGLTYTLQNEGCNVPQSISKQFEQSKN